MIFLLQYVSEVTDFEIKKTLDYFYSKKYLSDKLNHAVESNLSNDDHDDDGSHTGFKILSLFIAFWMKIKHECWRANFYN